jgi:hypothetical protein
MLLNSARTVSGGFCNFFLLGTKKIATSDGWERVRKLAPIVFVPSLVRLGEEWPEVYSF